MFTRALARGGYLSRPTCDTDRRVAVLGAGVATALFGDQDAIGQQITIAACGSG